jgi:hypothetical protein
VSCGSTTCTADEYCVMYMPGVPQGCGDGGIVPGQRYCNPYCAPRTCSVTTDQWCTCIGCPGPSSCDSLDPATRTVTCHNI